MKASHRSTRIGALACVVVLVAVTAVWLLQLAGPKQHVEVDRWSPQPAIAAPRGATDGEPIAGLSDSPKKLPQVGLTTHLRSSLQPDVVIKSPQSLPGSIAWKDGRPAGGVTVLGWPRSSPPADAQVLACLNGASTSKGSLVHAVSDERGRFVLEGVEAGQVYLVTAGAPGLLGSWGLASTRGRLGKPLKLTARAHHGVLVQRVDEYGALLSREAASFGPEYVVQLGGVHGSAAALGSVHRVLLGFSSSHWEPQSAGVLLSFTSDMDQAALGPLQFHARAPGYESQQVELEIPRTTNGLQTTRIFMEPDQALRGCLFIEVIGWSSSAEGNAQRVAEQAAATLKLRNTDTGKTTSCLMRFASSEPVLLADVPYGSYSATLIPRDKLALLKPLSPEDIVISANPATVIFDGRALGTLKIELDDDVAQLVAARAMFNVRPQSSVLLNSFTAFLSPPYVLEQVTPGDYTVFLYALDEPNGTGGRTVDVTVAPGVMTSVSISSALGDELPYEFPGMKR